MKHCLSCLIYYIFDLQNSRHFFIQSKVKPKPIETHSHAFSRALRLLRVFSQSSVDWLTGMSMSFAIGPLECLWPLWLAYWNVCGLCDWLTGMSVLWPLWFAQWYVCVLRDWLTGKSVAFVIGALECLCSLWLARMSTLVSVWWHSDEDRCAGYSE